MQFLQYPENRTKAILRYFQYLEKIEQKPYVILPIPGKIEQKSYFDTFNTWKKMNPSHTGILLISRK
jgi:hypothetical protein